MYPWMWGLHTNHWGGGVMVSKSTTQRMQHGNEYVPDNNHKSHQLHAFICEQQQDWARTPRAFWD